MSDQPEVVDADLDLRVSERGEIEVRPASAPPPPSLAVAPQVGAADLVERMTVIRDAMETAMVRDVDYGVIPGTDKPALLKPGSEKLSVLFQLDVQPQTTKTWGPGDHLTVECTAVVYHAPTGARLGKGEGLCSTREKKYGKRKVLPTCPNCDAANVRVSKNPGEGFYCWRKTDGCGATFPAGDQRITSQPTGEIDNPDLPDTWNTVVKMAEKRARIDAVLAVTGASALFTQDIEETGGAAGADFGSTPPAPRNRRTRGSSDEDPPTEAQRKAIKRGLADFQLNVNNLALLLENAGAGTISRDNIFDGTWITLINKGHASKIIKTLKSGVLPTGESDVPTDDMPEPANA